LSWTVQWLRHGHEGDDGAGVHATRLACEQALMVEIGGANCRPDGSTYHVTWSLANGREAVESNDVLRRGWTASSAKHKAFAPEAAAPVPTGTGGARLSGVIPAAFG
jgi:hypothetical protein